MIPWKGMAYRRRALTYLSEMSRQQSAYVEVIVRNFSSVFPPLQSISLEECKSDGRSSHTAVLDVAFSLATEGRLSQ